MLEFELLGYKIKLEVNKNKNRDGKIFFKRETKEIGELDGFYATAGLVSEIFKDNEDESRIILIWIVHNLMMKGNKLDYLQVGYVNGIKIWIIDDGENITFLLPDEY